MNSVIGLAKITAHLASLRKSATVCRIFYVRKPCLTYS